MPRTFHCVIYLLGSIRNHSVSQRAFASQHGEKAHGFALYGRHRVAGKREGCVLSSAKIKDTFRIIAISSRKISVFFEEKEQSEKTCGLFLDSSLVLCFSSLVSAESRDPFPHSPPAALLARVDTPPSGHAPAHRALNDFAFLAFTLHLHTQPSDNLPVVSEQKHDINTSPVKVKRVKPSPINTYSSTFYPTKVKR